MADGLHRDPTFDAAVAMEVKQKKGCGVCVQSMQLFDNDYLCLVNKTYPACKCQKNGYKYDEGE